MLALSIFNGPAATAATIVKAPGHAGSVVISVAGELVLGDENRFVQIAGTVAGAVVIFNSPGGMYSPGL